jgi:glycosyltransferase involved in cell wall biosynthesis
MKKYSFIVTIYNGEIYIDRCLESLLNQTYDDFEIIIVNDGSTDGTLKKLNIYAKKENRIKLYTTKNNGVSSARNYGMEKVTGDYAIFVDIDDYVDTDMLNYINDNIKNKKIDLFKYNYLRVNGGEEIKIDNNDDNSYITEGAKAFVKLVGNKIPFDLTCIYAFKMSFWKKHNFKFEETKYHEDFGLIPYVIMKAELVIVTNKFLYYYVQSENSITRNTNRGRQIKKFNDILYHFDNLFSKVKKDKTIKESDKVIFNSYIANAVILRYKELDKRDRKILKNEIEDRKIVDFLLEDTIIRKLKKKIYQKML